jgi:hypothetical protein
MPLNGDFIGDNKVFEINEGRENESGEQDAINERQRRRPAKSDPTTQEANTHQGPYHLPLQHTPCRARFGELAPECGRWSDSSNGCFECLLRV